MKEESKLIPAVIYARYSSSGQREESLTGQIRDCKAYADRCGYSIIHEYTDAAKTGTNDQRPAFQQMIKDSAKHTFQAVIVWKLDRFSRDKYDAARYKHVLSQNGVRVVSAMEPISSSPEGVIMESLLEGMAQYYSMDLSLKVKRGNRESALEHKTVGRRLLGYKPDETDHFALDPDTAPVIKRIFTEFDSGKSVKDIIAGLNNDGLRTLTGKPFAKASLQHILRNERYTGVYIFGDYRADGGMPAIIDKDTFNRVQARLNRHKRSPAASKNIPYLLTGKIFCGECGSAMTGECARGHIGKQYIYYRCTKRNDHTCKMRVSRDIIEDAVIEELHRVACDNDLINRIADDIIKRQEERQNDNSNLNAINARIQDIEKKLENIEKAIEAGIITSTTKARMEALEEQKSRLIKARDNKELSKQPMLTKDFILFWFGELSKGNVKSQAYREKLVDIFLEAVYVYDDGSCIIQTNIPGEKKSRITLQESDDYKKFDFESIGYTCLFKLEPSISMIFRTKIEMVRKLHVRE